MCENRGYLSTTTAVHHTHSEGSSGRLRFREQLTYLVLPFIIMSVSCCKAAKMSFLHYQAPSSERSELPLYTVCVRQPNFTYLLFWPLKNWDVGIPWIKIRCMRLASLASMPLTPLRLACHDYLVGKVGMSQCTTKAPRKFAWAEKPRYCKMILRLWSSSIVEVAAFYFSVHWLSRLRFPPNILWCAWISKLKQPFVDEITTPVKVVSFTTSMSRPFDVCYYFLWPELQAALVMWFCWAKMLLLAQQQMTCVVVQ